MKNLIHKILRISLLASILLALYFIFCAQKNEPSLPCVIKITKSNFPIEAVKVNITQNGRIENRIETERNGKISFSLLGNKTYELILSKKGYITQKIQVSTLGAVKSLSDVSTLEAEMFDIVEKVDTSFFANFSAKYAYSPSKQTLELDAQYSESVQADIQKVKKDIEVYETVNYGSDIDAIRDVVKNGDYDKAVDQYRTKREEESEGLKEIYAKIKTTLGSKEDAKTLASKQEIVSKVAMEQIHYLEDSLKKAEAKGNTKAVSNLLMEIGNSYFDMSSYNSAINYYKKSLSIEQKKNNTTATASIQNSIAVAYYNTGDYSNAINYLEKSLTLHEKDNNKAEVKNSLKDIALVYDNTFQYDKAIGNYQKALQITKQQSNSEEVASIANEIGSIYYEKNEIDSSLNYAKQTLSYDQKQTNKTELAKSLNNIGVLYYKKNDFENAMQNLEKAYQLTVANKDSSGMSSALNNMGNVKFRMEMYLKALEFYQKSLAINRTRKFNNNIAITLYNIANVYLKLKKQKEATDYYLLSINYADKVDNTDLLSKNYKSLNLVYATQGKYKEANDYNNRFIAINYPLNIETVYDQVAELRSKYDESRKDLQVAHLTRELKKQKLIARYESDRRIKDLTIKDLTIRRQEAINKKQQIILTSVSAFVLILIVFSLLLYRQFTQKKRANEQLVIKNHKIEEQQQSITSSIAYASLIQTAVLPPKSYIDTLLPEYFILYKPRDIVSGDFYWVDEKDSKIIIVAADCTGHGVPGAFMSMLGIAFLNEIIHGNSNLSAATILDELRRHIIESLHQTNDIEGSKDGMDLSLVIYDKENMEIQFAGAYNPLILIRNNELHIHDADKMPIAIFTHDSKNFSNHNIKLQPKDVIYMFSDGYMDQFGGPNQKTKFRYKQFKELLLTIHTLAIDDQKRLLDEAFVNWKGTTDQIDDVMVLGMRV